MKRIIYTLLFGVLSLTMSATHLLGGELSYEQTGTNKYTLRLKLFRDITGVNLGQTQTITQTGSSISNTTHSLNQVSTVTVQSGCGAGVDVVTYEKEITILSVPTSGFVFYWSSCCRPGGIDNIVSPAGQGFYVEAKMFPVPGQTYAGSSAQFLNPPTIAMIAGQSNVLNNFSLDPDNGDSIYVSFANPKQLSGTPVDVPFAAGYSSVAPFDSLTPTTLDSSTGIIHVQNPTTGVYTYALKIQSYTNGSLTSVIRRDIFSRVNNYNVTAPTSAVNQIQVNGGSYTSTGNSYTFNVQEMGQIQLDFNASFGAGSNDTVELRATGSMLDSLSGGSCSGAGCASFSPISGSLIGNNPTGHFQFTPDTSFVQGAGSRSTVFILEAVYKDSCNVQHTEYVNITVNVTGSTIWPEQSKYFICQGGAVQAQIFGDTSNLLWSPAVGVSNVNSATPTLSPTASILYNVMNLNDSNSILIEVQVDPQIPNFGLNYNGTDASIPGNIIHTSVTWYYNGAAIMMNSDTLTLFTSGSYYAMVVNNSCTQYSDTLKINMKNQAQTTGGTGTVTSLDEVSRVVTSFSYNQGANVLNKMNILIPDSGIFKTASIAQIEIYDNSVSSLPIFTTQATKVNDMYWTTPTFGVNLIGGRQYQVMIYFNDTKIPLFTPDSFPYTDPNDLLTFHWSTAFHGNGTNMSNVVPFMTFQFASSIGIEESKGMEHSIFPNPFSGSLNIDTEGLNTFVLMDALGRVIRTVEFENHLQIETSELASGVYIYRIDGENGSASGKLVKE